MHMLTDDSGQYGFKYQNYLDDIGTGVDLVFIMQTITQSSIHSI